MRITRNVKVIGDAEEEKPNIGVKTTPPTPQEKLQTLDRKLEKAEIKTEKVLKKLEYIKQTHRIHRADKEDTKGIHKADTKDTQGIHLKRDVSYDTYTCISKRKVTRQVLDIIRKNAFKKGDQWLSIVDTAEAMEQIDKKNFHLKTTFARLRKQGWFEIVEASPGFRRLSIDPKVFGLE